MIIADFINLHVINFEPLIVRIFDKTDVMALFQRVALMHNERTEEIQQMRLVIYQRRGFRARRGGPDNALRHVTGALKLVEVYLQRELDVAVGFYHIVVVSFELH